MRVCLMIEGQEGVSWESWVALARTCEEHGLEGLFRSDHYGSTVAGGARASLDAWATLAALAPLTERIRLGTLVSPVGFRHPSVLAKSALTVDHASGGRVEVGLGAGWMEREHRAFGFDFPDVGTRTVLLAEHVEIVHRQLLAEPFSFAGEYLRLEECVPLPPPVQQPRPPLIVGGRGGRGTLAPAVRFADEYNTPFRSVEECADLRRKLDDACDRHGREPRSLPLSLMTGCVVAADGEELRERLRRRIRRGNGREDPDGLRRRAGAHSVFGTPREAIERLRAYGDAGVERVMLQHLDHEDLAMVELIGREIVPVV
ncbi:MAG: LLM class flavin-dependent oxidoreductase [Actinomycetota bacterium]|nr:LLM class flavin-dependent oxidoreductase [Actinomycetota bacterium]